MITSLLKYALHVFIGIGAGIKLFIIDNVYRKYPKVKKRKYFLSSSLFSLQYNIMWCIFFFFRNSRFYKFYWFKFGISFSWLKVKAKYDTVAQLWKELPTNEELVRRQALTEEQLVRPKYQ